MRNPETEARVQRLLDVIRQSISLGNPIPTVPQLVDRIGVGEKAVRKYLNMLANRGEIIIRFDGKFRMVTDRLTGREQSMGIRHTTRKSRLPKTDRTLWSDAETQMLREGMLKGLSVQAIAAKLGRPLCGVSNKMKSIRQREASAVKPEPVRSPRWTCQNCNTRSDASLEFGCRACLPMRSAAA